MPCEGNLSRKQFKIMGQKLIAESRIRAHRAGRIHPVGSALEARCVKCEKAFHAPFHQCGTAMEENCDG